MSFLEAFTAISHLRNVCEHNHALQRFCAVRHRPARVSNCVKARQDLPTQ